MDGEFKNSTFDLSSFVKIISRHVKTLIQVCGGISAILGCLLVPIGLIFIYLLPGKIVEFSNEPEDVYGVIVIFLLTSPLGLLMVWSGILLLKERPLSVRESRVISYSLLGYFIAFAAISSVLLVGRSPDSRPDEWLSIPMAVAIAIIVLSVLGKKKLSRLGTEQKE